MRVPFGRCFLCVLLGLIAVWCLVASCRYKLVAHYTSPDNQYCLDLYSDRIYFGFPGSSLDRPAKVVLYDGRTGRTLNSSRLEMLQYFEQVDWKDDEVRFSRILGFRLNGEKIGDW